MRAKIRVNSRNSRPLLNPSIRVHKLARFIVRHRVTFESHALMQNPHDEHTVLIVQKENHVGLEIHPPQSRGKMRGASTAVWIFRESAEYLFQSVPVASRLFDAELS